MDIKVSSGGRTIANITSFTFGSLTFNTILEVTPTGADMTLKLSENTSVVLATVDGGVHFKSVNPASIQQVGLSLKDNNEHFYGITQHNIEANPDLRGKSNILDKVTAYQRKDEDAEVYSGFFFTSLGYAGYFDGFATGAYNFGVGGQTSIIYNTSAIDWYLFYGPELGKIQQSYFKVIGAPRKVPMWACGPLVWHDSYTGSAMILDHAANFETAKIPYSTIWVDRPYNSGANGWSNMNFEGAFGNPGTWVKKLSDEYFVNLVTWIMPGTFAGSPPPGAFTGTDNQYLDLTDPAQVSWYMNKIKSGQYAFGVKGHKLDRIDNGWGVTVPPPFKDGTPAEARHKKYAFLNCKVTDDMLRQEGGPGENSFLFPRCAVNGCQKHISAIWNGDTYAGYVGLKTSVGNALRAGFLGFPMWGSDVGGYTQKGMPTIDNYCRWLAFGVYSGFMELMLDGKEPWKLSAENQALVRDQFNQRMNLLPYVYSILNNSATLGVSMMPLVGAYPDDPNTYANEDEYLFGPSMLVAPLLTQADSRTLYLPAGNWVNYHNYTDVQAGGKTITSSPVGLTQIPVYIKSNSIFPTGRVFAGLAKKWEPGYDATRTLNLNVFPGAPGETTAFPYVDYLDGDKPKTLAVAVSATNGISITAPAMTVAGNAVVRLPTAPTAVYLGGTPVPTQYDAATMKLTVPFPANLPISIGINEPSISTVPMVEPNGGLTYRRIAHGVELSLPGMSGLGRDQSAIVEVVDMQGKAILKQSVTLSPVDATPVVLKPGKGVFLVKVNVRGILALSRKLTLL